MAKNATKLTTDGDAIMRVSRWSLWKGSEQYIYEMRSSVRTTLWLVQKGRKRASFTNEKAAMAFAGKTGKIHKYVEVPSL